MSPLPHAALISAWLGGHRNLYSYSLVAGDTLLQFFHLPNNNLLSQLDLSSALPVAMAPSQTEKGKKKSQSSAAPPPGIESAIGRLLVLNQEAMDKVRPALATGFNEWGNTVA